MIKKPARKTSTRAKKDYSALVGTVKSQTLSEFMNHSMGIYAEEVNLDRAVPDLIDGLKPVQRRIMWAATKMPHEMVKTARVVGEVIGRYHPHGDVGVAKAIETIMHSNVPTMRGQGNWGSLIDRAAAQRYTQCMLSAYGDTFFDPNYINPKVTTFVPNFDDTTVEPSSLPALLPNVLINGGEGIGVGTTTKLPTFTPESLGQIIQRLLKGEKLTSVDFAKTLKYNYRYGGIIVKSKPNAQAWLEMFRAPQAKVLFQAQLTVIRDEKAIEVTEWPEGLNPLKFIKRVRLFPEVERAENHKGSTGFRIDLKRDHNYAQFDKLVAKVQKLATVSRSFRINVTHRRVRVEEGSQVFDTEFRSLSVPQLLVAWLKERIDLEKRSLIFRIEKQNQAIAYTELLIWAAPNAEALIKCIKASEDPKAALMKKFKLTEEQAQQILDLQLKSLSRFDQGKLKEKLSAQKKHLLELKAWQKKPKEKVAADTAAALASLVKDKTFEQSKQRKMSVA